MFECCFSPDVVVVQSMSRESHVFYGYIRKIIEVDVALQFFD